MMRDDRDERTVVEFVKALGSDDAHQRTEARQALVEAGPSAVGPLCSALQSPNWRARWEAAKALGAIRPAEAVDPLVLALEDRNQDVRWVAAEALVALGKNAVAPLLRALIDRGDSPELRRSGHHVLHDLARNARLTGIDDVVEALDERAPVQAIPAAALAALRKLEARSSTL